MWSKARKWFVRWNWIVIDLFFYCLNSSFGSITRFSPNEIMRFWFCKNYWRKIISTIDCWHTSLFTYVVWFYFDWYLSRSSAISRRRLWVKWYKGYMDFRTGSESSSLILIEGHMVHLSPGRKFRSLDIFICKFGWICTFRSMMLGLVERIGEFEIDQYLKVGIDYNFSIVA